jgi:glycosyltransferase involved in cell wall biosynthesis
MKSRSGLKILIAPAHFLFSDKYGSEPGYSYSITKYLADNMESLDVIAGIVDLEKPLPPNVRLISIYKTRGNHPLVGFLKYMFFMPLVFIKYLTLFKKYDLIHHMFPTSPHTIDPLFIFIKLFTPSTKLIIGPLQLESQLNTPQDFSIMLIGQPKVTLISYLLRYIFNFALVVTKPLSMWTFSCADRIVCNFNVIKSYYSNIHSPLKIEVIPTGVDPFNRAYLPKPLSKKTITIVSVGRLMPHKGHQYLLEAFSRLAPEAPQVNLVILGSGNLLTQYEQYVNSTGLTKRVIFTGHISRREVDLWYQKSDIFCLPSLVDTNPVVVIEAMSYGLPVVATDVGAVREIVSTSGIMVEKNNSNQIYLALKDLVDDRTKREQMGKSGLSRASHLYNWQAIAKQWTNLYSRIMGQ